MAIPPRSSEREWLFHVNVAPFSARHLDGCLKPLSIIRQVVFFHIKNEKSMENFLCIHIYPFIPERE